VRGREVFGVTDGGLAVLLLVVVVLALADD
jgi:hypothetical protein